MSYFLNLVLGKKSSIIWAFWADSFLLFNETAYDDFIDNSLNEIIEIGF